MSNEPDRPDSPAGSSLRETPLHKWHVAAGAKMADFAGWDMPIEFPAGTVAEHRAVRSGCGLFDVSHMGTLIVEGSAAVDEVGRMLTNDVGRLADGDVQYTLLCSADGGVVDDMLVTRLSADRLLLVPNAANTEAVKAALAPGLEASGMSDLSAGTALVAVQGPGSAQVVESLGLPASHPYMSVRAGSFAGVEVMVSRTGYTGERGYELLVPSAVAAELWEALVEQPQTAPCGLGARDTLRTEMGYPLHGQDIGPAIDPVSAGLSWAIAWDTDFIGRAALERIREQGPKRRLRGVCLTGRGVPRPGMSVRSGGTEVGTTTSGTFSPIRRKGIALALVDAEVEPGDGVDIDVRGRQVPAEIVKPPFVDSSPR